MGSSSTLTVGDLGEHALIARIKTRVPSHPSSVMVWIGDDAAVVEPDRGTLTVMTTDAMVEHVHFDRTYTPMDAVGHKALAINLSDLAAMGATPRQALLSLALPSTLCVAELDALMDGMLGLAARYRVTLVGGNISASTTALFIDVTAVGSVKRRRVLTRSGARPGDDVYVSGTVGQAAAGLACLMQTGEQGHVPDELDSCRTRFLFPEPRVRLGTQLGRNRAAHACLDLSDGLSDGIRQLTAASRVGATIDADAIPLAPNARRWCLTNGLDPVTVSLTAAEDYELLFTSPPAFRRRIAAVKRLSRDIDLTWIGRITKDTALVLVRDGKEEALQQAREGFEHFRS